MSLAPISHRSVLTVALATKDMRNMMIVSLAVYMAALNIFFVARALTFASRMPSLERRAFA